MKRLRLLKIFNSNIEAEIARSFLESSDIKSFIISDDAGSMYPSQGFVNGVRLMVDQKDLPTASGLLNELENNVET